MTFSKSIIVAAVVLVAIVSCGSHKTVGVAPTKQTIPVREDVGPQNMPLEILPVDA